jgi:hypothetical protein
MPIEANGLHAIALDGWWGPFLSGAYKDVTIDGRTALHEDSISNFPILTYTGGIPAPANVYATGPNRFYKLGVVDPHQPFTLTVRTRLTAYAARQYTAENGAIYSVPGDASKGFCFLVSTGTEEYGFCLNSAYSQAVADKPTRNYPAAIYLVGSTTMSPSATLDDKFHTYQLDVTPGTGSKLYRLDDGQLLGSGTNTGTFQGGRITATNQAARNGLYLGDTDNHTSGLARGDITDFWYLPRSTCAVAGAQPAQ